MPRTNLRLCVERRAAGRMVALLLVLAAMPAGMAQDTLTLRQAVDIALQNNYSIRIARNQQRIAENDVTRGNAGLLPVLAATAQTNNNYNILFKQKRQVFQSVVDPVTKDTLTREVTQVNEFNGRTNIGLNAGLTLNWSIFGAALTTNYRRLEEIRAAGRENTEATLENTVAAVTNAYFNISQQEQRRVVLADALKISQERLRLAKNRYDVGSGSRQEYFSAQVDYNTDQSALIGQEQQAAAARIGLNQLLARTPDTPVAVSDSLMVDTALPIAALRAAVNEQNPALLVAQRNKNVTYLNTRLVQAQRLPLVNVFTGLSRNFQNSRAFIVPNLTNSLVLNYGIAASIPLFDGGNQNRQVRNARIAQETADFQYQELRMQVLADVETAYVAYANSLKLMELERQNLQVARQNVTVALERYRTGVTTSLEVRDVQRNAVATESRLIDATFNAKLAETELLRLSGRLVE